MTANDTRHNRFETSEHMLKAVKDKRWVVMFLTGDNPLMKTDTTQRTMTFSSKMMKYGTAEQEAEAAAQFAAVTHWFKVQEGQKIWKVTNVRFNAAKYVVENVRRELMAAKAASA